MIAMNYELNQRGLERAMRDWKYGKITKAEYTSYLTLLHITVAKALKERGNKNWS